MMKVIHDELQFFQFQSLWLCRLPLFAEGLKCLQSFIANFAKAPSVSRATQRWRGSCVSTMWSEDLKWNVKQFGKGEGERAE